jgi:hypothetical protein
MLVIIDRNNDVEFRRDVIERKTFGEYLCWRSDLTRKSIGGKEKDTS